MSGVLAHLSFADGTVLQVALQNTGREIVMLTLPNGSARFFRFVENRRIPSEDGEILCNFYREAAIEAVTLAPDYRNPFEG